MNRTLFALAAIALLAVPVVTKGQADTRPTVAVLPLNNGAIQPELAPLSKGFEDMLITQLAMNTKIRVVERAHIQKILEEQRLGVSGQVDPQTAARIGKILGARYMVTGGFITNPSKMMTINLRVIDVETTQIIFTDGSAQGPVDKLMDLIVKSSDVLNTKLNLPQLPPGPARDQANATTEKNKKMPLATAMLYAKAIEAQDAGKKDEARTLYKQVVDKFPYQPAQDALNALNKQ